MSKVDILQAIGDPGAGAYALCYMRVCADKSATDEEILSVCNVENPAGTENGWSRVIRADEDLWKGSVTCGHDATREHLIVVC